MAISKREAAKKIASKVKSKTKSKRNLSVERYQSQGQGNPQSKAWTEPNDEGVAAKPVGWRWTNLGASKLGKNPDSRPSNADVESYSKKSFKVKGETHRYLYTEKRVDKSDKNRSAKFYAGGTTGAGTFENGGTVGAGSFAKGGKVDYGSLYQKIIKAVQKDLKISNEKASDLVDKNEAFIIDMINEGESINNIVDAITSDYGEYHKKGGATFGGRQYDPYNEDADGQKIGKPIGWRYTDKLAKRLGKNVHSRPTTDEVEKYAGRGVYYEARQDKSDAKPSKKFISLQDGGTTGAGSFAHGGMMAKGGRIDEMVKSWEKNKTAYSNINKDDTEFFKRIKLNPMKIGTSSDTGSDIFYYDTEIYNDYKDAKRANYKSQMADGGTLGAGSFKDGGDVRQKGSQSGNPTRSLDKAHQAKPVGFRFRGNKYRRPSEQHIRQQLKLSPADRDIYKEVRKDKSDYSFEARLENGGGIEGAGMFARGGSTQYVSNDMIESITLTNGRVIKNDRIYDGAYVSKSLKLENGGDIEGAGMFARGGGVERVANSQSRDYSENLIPFKGANLEGKTLDNGDYVVLSYGYYPIWWYCKAEGKWYGNSTKYSVTTSKQMSQSRPTYDAKMVTKNELTDLMMKHHARFEDGGMLDGILGDTGAATTNGVGGTSFSSLDLTSNMDLTNPAF